MATTKSRIWSMLSSTLMSPASCTASNGGLAAAATLVRAGPKTGSSRWVRSSSSTAMPCLPVTLGGGPLQPGKEAGSRAVAGDGACCRADRVGLVDEQCLQKRATVGEFRYKVAEPLPDRRARSATDSAVPERAKATTPSPQP